MDRKMAYDSRHNTRRLIGVGGLILSSVILLVAIILALNERQSIFPRSSKASSGQTSPATCTTPHNTTGDNNGSITSDGLKRTFLIHLAPSYGKQAQPLIINYHGYNWTSQIMEHNTQMDAEADRAGFVLVFPQGIDSPPSWNAGVGAYGPTGDADDVQFTRDLLSYLEKNYCVDTHRVYIAGFSLGGGMAYRVACALSDRIAALATVSGAYYPIPEGCQPTRPLPVLEIHGAADTQAYYNGTPAAHMAGVQEYLNGWLERDRCSGNAQIFFRQGDVTGSEWTHCADGVIVRHYRISDGGHTWPGTPNTTHVIDGNVVIWQFFSQFSYPPPGSKPSSAH